MRDIDPETLTRVLDPEHLDLPERPRVRRIQWEPYVDSLGDDALRITVLLDNRTPVTERSWARIQPIERAIVAALDAIREKRFPYIDCLTPSEFRRRKVG
jgi:hypothetical protein